MKELITMTKKELFRFGIIQRLIDEELNGTEAARKMNLTVRQTKRLKARVKEQGAKGLIHSNRGRKSNKSIPEKEKDKIISLLNRKYYDFGPTFAAEKLSELHKITRDAKTIRQIMIDEGLWQPKKGRSKQTHRSWRKRKDNFGEMMQFDGSYHKWFEDRAPKCCLLLAVDDATSKLVYGKFDKDEGVFPVFKFWLEYVKKYCKPMSIYVDRFSTYKMTQKVAKNNHDLKTQFQRAMETLHIEPIFAKSAEAKGRVERQFKTLQDRLVKELRLNNISSIQEANIYLKEIYIPMFNSKFSVKPKRRADFHTKLSRRERQQLPSIFSRHGNKVVQNDFTISHNTQWYQLTGNQPVTVCKRDSVTVEEHTDGQIKIRFKGKYLNFKPIDKFMKRKKKATPWVLPATNTNTSQVGHF